MVFYSKKTLATLSLALMTVVTACSSGGPSGGSTPASTDKNATKQAETKTAGGPSNSKNISIGTTPVGVSYNSIGNGLAKVISTNSDITVSVKPTNGISAWGPQLNKGQIQLGVGSAPDLAWAYKGENGYQRTENMRLLVNGNYLDVTGAAVRKDSNIKSIADLKGKKVAAEYPGSAIAKSILEAALTVNGLTWNDVKKVPIPNTGDGITALQDKRVEAAFALVPSTPVIQEVNNAVGLRSIPFLDKVTPDKLKEIPKDLEDKVRKIVPGTKFSVVKADGYITEDQIGIKYQAQMVASSQLDDETVYKIMDTIWNHYKELAPIHVWLKEWTPENMFDPNPSLPYHPGAVKFFKDKGLWNADVEKAQQQLIGSSK